MTNRSTFIHGKYFRMLCSKMLGLWLSSIQRSLQNPQHTSSGPPGCSSPKCYAPGPNADQRLGMSKTWSFKIWHPFWRIRSHRCRTSVSSVHRNMFSISKTLKSFSATSWVTVPASQKEKENMHVPSVHGIYLRSFMQRMWVCCIDVIDTIWYDTSRYDRYHICMRCVISK